MEPLADNPTTLRESLDLLHSGFWTGQKIRQGFILYVISSSGVKDHVWTWTATKTLINLKTQPYVQDSYCYTITQSLTWDSLGCSTPESGCTERTLRSELQTLQWKCNATLLKFLMLRVVLEQEPTAVGMKNKLPSPSKVMRSLSATHTMLSS